jgi:ABC-type multidrug transport system ATPase subunit
MEIKIQSLTKIYNDSFKAICDIDLTIHDGLFGLLGPNGAGKTTLMRILVTLLDPTLGEVTIDGMDLKKDRSDIRKILGYLPQDFNTFSKVKAWEFLDYSARLAGIKEKKRRSQKIEEMLEKVGLYEARDRLANKLSGGMKRRLGIAQALISDPKLLVVDEPTTGLDPEERIRFRNILSDMGQEERIIILSTHIVGDISSTCTDMALLLKGSLAFNGAPDAFIEYAKDHTFLLKVTDEQLESVKEKYAVISTIPGIEGWQVEVVADAVDEANSEQIDPNLEHAYVYFVEFLTQKRVIENVG